MMRHVSGVMVLLVLAIVFVVAVLFTRTRPPQVEDQVADAVEEMYDTLGFRVSGTMARGGGLTVEQVKADSPAQHLGIRAGDRFVAVNDRSIWHAKDMLDQLSGAMAAGPVSLLVEKDGVYRQVIVGGRRALAAGGAPGAGRRAPGRRAPSGAPARSP